jgi:hypothetical protein
MAVFAFARTAADRALRNSTLKTRPAPSRRASSSEVPSIGMAMALRVRTIPSATVISRRL